MTCSAMRRSLITPSERSRTIQAKARTRTEIQKGTMTQTNITARRRGDPVTMA